MNALALVLLIGLCGGIGSALRYLTDISFPKAWRERYPWGTTTVNLVGSFCMGLLVGAPSFLGPWHAVVAAGLLGGFTTFSSAMADSISLIRTGRITRAVVNTFVQLIAAVALAGLGIALVS
ncbi:fluoride efflux transporter FluC [Rarobacter incanus]|uniref:Fluoride-specific ion channel FluC n=1 Tax=Rarobacter incanus TaxID=153494 RepID=A0A542SND4_9MICO|nr:CrcB family protein [Rarobacter incanus]TQK76144.1 camphor resistance protein CrcB [Rarobacter incanus]